MKISHKQLVSLSPENLRLVSEIGSGLLESDKISSINKGRIAELHANGARPDLRKVWEISELPASEFADEVARLHGLPRVSLSTLLSALALTEALSPRFLRDSSCFPFAAPDGRTVLALADPEAARSRKAVELALGRPVELAVASFEEIAAALAERLGGEERSPSAPTAESAREDESVDTLRDLASGAPVVRAVDELVEKAVELRASDIHIEPMRGGLTVRMRIDGLLRQVAAPEQAPAHALVSRIKILSGLNIAERRLPQDGAARLRVGRGDIDVRVATMPTQHGEAAVIRLLPRDRGLLDMARLGFAAADDRKLRAALALPHGMIVVTGPTGSGKTTTLATLLSSLNSSTRKILTVEDPVEYELPGISQSQVKPAIGLTFATALRAFVRQDPDVIMVGEIRDAETASVAVHAALTGHLVLTTLHTETATAAAPRLLDLGVEGFLLRSVLRVSVGQRLVRLLCSHCRTRRTLGSVDFEEDPRLESIGLRVGETVYEPRGCERCGGIGYRGRVGVFEIFETVGEARDLIGPGIDLHRLDEAARRQGMTTMMEDAVAKCRTGVTSTSEVLRVTTMR